MNTTLIHADIFFFITTVVVLILAVGLIILLAYIIKIAQSFQYIVKKIEKESDHISNDIAELRSKIREEGMKSMPFAMPVIGFISRLIFSKKKENSRRKTHKDDTSINNED